MSENKVTLEVLEPRGVLENAHREGLSNPRLTDLNGKTLALMSIHVDNLFQFGSELFFNILEEELLKRYPDIKFYRCKSFGSPSAVVNADEIAAKCDAWVEGVKDAITQGKRDVGVFMERAGKPGVSICSDVLLRSKSALQDLNGMPAVRLTTVPATAYCAAKRNEEQMRKVVEGCVDDLIAKLTAPLTDEEKRSYEREYDYGPKTFTGANYSEAYEKWLEYCSENYLNDGLPVVPPTREAVEWMLTGTSYPRDRLIGYMYPKRGAATVEKIAIASVMAGAKPEWLPVIITIIETITDPNFNQFHIVNEILPAIFISGPIIEELGICNKIGYLAPGHRINSTIGRAVLICMTAIGWRDMTIYSSPGGPGRPAAYANIFVPENQEENPWESWAEQNGYAPDESIITVCEWTSQTRGPAEVMSNDDFEERLAAVSAMFSRKSDIFRTFGMPEDGDSVRHMLVLHPALAKQMADAGFTKQSLIQYFYDKNVIDYDSMTQEQRDDLIAELKKEKAEANKKMFALTPENVKPGLHMEPFNKPEHVLVFVAGSGAGNTAMYQTVFGSSATHAEDVKEPRPYMSKVIHGATLSKYGK